MTSTAGRQRVELLLVEDNPDDARHIQRLLTSGRTVSEAEQLIEFGPITHTERLSETLAVLENRTPDIVLLDLRLPDSDGLETLERVVDNAPDLPVVVVTGSADAGLGPKAIQTGAQDYLKKASITDELLRRTFRYAMYRHERDREIATTNRQLMLLNRILWRDVRNDASLIVGQADELRDHVDQDGGSLVDRLLDTAHDTVERIETVTVIMDSLSTDLDVQREPVDLVELIEREAARIRDQHDVDLNVIRSDGVERPVLPATPTLSSVFRQLLSNAVLHTDKEVPQVDVLVKQSSDRITVTVADDGTGIPDRLRKHLNDAEARNRDQSGIGTGLFLVLTILDGIGAKIEFADNEPRGTVVRVSFERATT